MSNEEFFEKFAVQGAVGLVGGSALIDESIKKAQKKITKDKKASFFSHAFIISEKRMDDKWWVIESDLEFHRKQVKLGVQENRIDKYFDDKLFPNVAILDFNLSSDARKSLLAEGLNLVAARSKYSLREIFGMLWSFTKEERADENIFSQDNSFVCSSLVQHCYSKAAITFNPQVSLKHLTPEDIFTTPCIHTVEKLIREK